MYKLIGTKRQTYYDEEYTEVVAKFTSEALAKNYLKDSKLKNPTWRSPFRQKSLLAQFDSAAIEDESEEYIPIDPEI
jgi:hypothetical protein